VLIAAPDESTAIIATAAVRERNPAVPILARARSGVAIGLFLSLDANEIVPPEYEGGPELMNQTLTAIGFDAEEALHLTYAIRDIHYQAAERGQHPSSLASPSPTA